MKIDILDALELLKDRADGHVEKILTAAIDEIRTLRQEIEQHESQRVDS